MRAWQGWLLLGAYIVGLLATGLSWLGGGPLLGLALLGAMAIAGGILPRLWPGGPAPRLWIMMGVIALFATVYYGLRLPQPSANDVSRLIPPEGIGTSLPVVTVRGSIDSRPRLTRGDRIQFWLRTQRILEVTGKTKAEQTTDATSGRLYVTVPLLQGTGLFPNQLVDVTGVLYRPKPAAYAGGFDFARYLARQGGFSGLQAYQLTGTAENTQPPLGWQLRQRIIQVQTGALGSPGGPLLSAMVVGSRGVDLPFDIQDLFRQVGLSHVIAVSGFHVALVLGVVLQLTKRLSARFQFLLGSATLGGILLLTGLQPSVLRAVLMGLGALVALVIRRKTVPLGGLLVSATLLLLYNPLWIWDLGFQLSFLATLGLLVTVPPMMRRLDWLPTVLGAAMAVPLAATLWTLPLQLYHFGVVAPYGIVVNLLVTPLVSLSTLGGFASGGLALIWPSAGDVVARFSGYAVQGMLAIAQFFAQLPGATYAFGKLALPQVGLFYGLMLLVRLSRAWRQRWWVAAALMVLTLLLPLQLNRLGSTQITVLSDNPPILVIQDQGKVGLVNSGASNTVSGQIIPFFQHQGINKIDWALSTQSDDASRQGWLRLLAQMPVGQFYDAIPAAFPPQQSGAPATGRTDGHGEGLETPAPGNNAPSLSSSTDLALAAGTADSPAPDRSWIRQQLQQQLTAQKASYSTLQPGQTFTAGQGVISIDPRSDRLWHYRRGDQTWLWLFDLDKSQQNALAQKQPLEPVNLLWWSGESIAPLLLQQTQPQTAIAAAQTLDPDTLRLMAEQEIPVYWTGRDGAVQWSPPDAVRPSRESLEVDTSPL